MRPDQAAERLARFRTMQQAVTSRDIGIWSASRWSQAAGLRALLFFVLFIVALPAIADAETNGRRVALVIGNQAYEHVSGLDNPLNDTAEVSRLLTSADFEVTQGTDLTKLEMEKLVRTFLRSLEEGDTALFYYSGHAIQVGDANYVIPVDAKLTSQYDLEFESLNVSHLLDYMKASSSLQIVMLDACRDNPFEIGTLFLGEEKYELGKTRGLRRIPNRLGSLISYATRPGEVAYDGEGPLSPFTAAVVSHALNPQLEIRDLLTVVRDEVVKKTGGRQIPWEDSTLVTSFYFVPPKPEPVVAPLYQVSVVRSGEPQPLNIPAPVQPEGGDMEVAVTLAPQGGTLARADGSVVTTGARLTIGELTGLTYVPGDDVAPVQLLSYAVKDAYGGTANGIATIAVTEPVAKPEPAVEPKAAPVVPEKTEAETALELFNSWLAIETGKSGDETLRADIGTGGTRILADVPVEGLDPDAGWVTVEAADPDLQLAVGSRKLQPGDKVAAMNLATVTVDPVLGTAGQAKQVAFSYQRGPADFVDFSRRIDVELHACDLLAAQPFDLQAVSEGLLANELKVDEAEAACDVAMTTYPDVPRFLFQRGRVAFAKGELKEARRFFGAAYEAGHVRAGQVLGRMHFLGAGGPRDQARATEFYRKAADKGDAYALHSLALAELNGIGTAKNKEAGLKKLLKAVEAGHTFSYNALGTFYLKGEHVEQNLIRALYYYTRSAARQDIYGYLNMGTLYRDGRGVKPDPKAAFDWFQKAHEGGHPAAGTAIGLLYFNGQGVDKDMAAARKWFQESAMRGDPWGAYNTAFMIKREGNSPALQKERALYLAKTMAVDPASPAAEKARKDLAALPARIKTRLLQEQLKSLGFDPGTPDGAFGRKSQAALNAFYKEHGQARVKGDQRLVAVVEEVWNQERPRYDLF